MLKRIQKFRLATLLGFVTCAVIGMAIYHSLVRESVRGYATPEAAATAMFRACAARDPRLFVRARMLGVCEGKNDWHNRYAEFLHTTTFANGQGDVTAYELPWKIRTGQPRVVARQVFGKEHDRVLTGLMLSSYYGEKYVCVEVAANHPNELEHRSRIVVAKLNDRWYGIPRLRRSEFYRIADDMQLTPI